MSAKLDMGGFQNSGLEQRLALLGKNGRETDQNRSNPLPFPELELKSQKEKVEAGDNDNQLFIFAFKSNPNIV